MKTNRKNQKQISISIGNEALKIINDLAKKKNRNRSNCIETIILCFKDQIKKETLAI